MIKESDCPAQTDRELEQREIYTVSRLNREARALLGQHFVSIWVEGEISNLASPSSGHLYFTLKDNKAQIRCAMFRGQRRQLNFRPEDGCLVLVKAQVSLYELRGDYQLIVDFMEEGGDGALRRAFEALKIRLSEQGLFDPSSKKPIPEFPDKIGVITSPTGAAIRDILSILKRRFPAIPVVVYPVAVQGSAAKIEIADAIATADRRQDCNVLLVARGGGSLEDLWAFNEEEVALAISRCSIPIISAVGHETDFTIADFVADLRAATPSAAAESVSPEQTDWMRNFIRMEDRIGQIIGSRIEKQCEKVSWLGGRLQLLHPGKRLLDRAQRTDELEIRLYRSIKTKIGQLGAAISTCSAQLYGYNPQQRIATLIARQEHSTQRLMNAAFRLMDSRKQRLSELGHTLDTVSPLATLSRGYAITSRQDNGKILRSAKETKTGEIVETKLASGHLVCTVDEVIEG